MDTEVKYILPHVSEQTVNRLEKSDRNDIDISKKILNLIQSLTEYKTIDVERKINKYIENETSSKIVFIGWLVNENIVINVISQTILQIELKLSAQNYIYREVLKTKLPILKTLSYFETELQNLLENEGIEHDSSYDVTVVPYVIYFKKTKLRTVPILIFIIHSTQTKDCITEFINTTFKFCYPILAKTKKLEEKTKTKRQCQLLLQVIRKMFAQIGNSMDSLNNIVIEVRKFMNAECCSLFLLEPNGKHLVDVASDRTNKNVPLEIRIAKDESIEGRVLATGKLINIQNQVFSNSVNENKDWIRNVLCFPIRDEYGIVGVLRVCNKIEGDFNRFDEEVAVAFSIYCGLCIKQSLVHIKLHETNLFNKISNELLIEQSKINEDDVKRAFTCTKRHAFVDYYCFNFSSHKIISSETPCLLLRIFRDLNFIETFGIKEVKLVRFILYIMKISNNAPYHNWIQAFSNTHFAYVLIKQLKLIENNYLSDLEALAYVISCMCFNIDHKGTVNFLELPNVNAVENLYLFNETVIKHSISKTYCILNTENFNFLECLKPDDFEKCLKHIKTMLKATNLSNHFHVMDKQRSIVELQQKFEPSNPEHKYTLICLLMTCAQFSDQLKNWDQVKMIAQCMYNELFLTSSCESKNHAEIPQIQVQFLFSTCLPVFLTLSDIFPATTDLVSKIHKHILNWESLFQNGKTSVNETKTHLNNLSNYRLSTYIKAANFPNLIQLLSAKIEKFHVLCICIVYTLIFTILVRYYSVL